MDSFNLKLLRLGSQLTDISEKAKDSQGVWKVRIARASGNRMYETVKLVENMVPNSTR